MTRTLLISASLLPLLTLRAGAQSYEEQRDKLVTDLAAEIERAGKNKVATTDFVDLQGKASDLGRFLSEEMSIGLVMAKKPFVVVDRANLNRLMAEHKLTMSGLVDPENTKKLGQFSGAEALVIGTITDLGNDLVLAVKITSTDTAEIVGGARAKIAKSTEIKKLLDGYIDEPDDLQGTLNESTGTSGSPALGERARVADTKTLSEVTQCRQELAAAQAEQERIAGRLRESEAKVTQLSDKLANVEFELSQKTSQLEAAQRESLDRNTNKSHYRSNWNQLNGWLGAGRVITAKDVIEVVGSPKKIAQDSALRGQRYRQIWHYGSAASPGYICFSADGRVSSIDPPAGLK